MLDSPKIWLSYWLANNSEFTQQDGRKKTTAKRLCVTNVTGLFLAWSSLKLMFSGLLQKELFKGGCRSAEMFFQQNYCHACHTRFAVFFPLPSCCVSSLISLEDCLTERIMVFLSYWLLYLWNIEQKNCIYNTNKIWAELFKAGVKLTQGLCHIWIQTWKLKSNFSFILIVYNLMILCSKNSRGIFPRCFWTKEKETRIKI